MMMTQHDLKWLNQTVMDMSEKMADIDARLEREHDAIVDLKQTESSKYERDKYFIENMSKISTVLDRLDRELVVTRDEFKHNQQETRKELNTINKQVNFIDTVSSSLKEMKTEVKDMKEDVDFLMSSASAGSGRSEAMMWIIPVFITVIGLIVGYFM